MRKIKISLSLIIMLAFLSLGFFSVAMAEPIPVGPNGEELTPGPENASEAGLAENSQTESAISDELAGVSEEPPIPTPENSIELKDESIEEESEEVALPMTNISDVQPSSSFKEKLPFIIIIVVMVSAALLLLVFAFRKFRERK